MNKGPFLIAQNDFQQLPHVIFDGFGIGSSEFCFQLQASSFLGCCHSAFSPQFAVGEVDEEISFLFHCYMKMDGVVLAQFEGFEAIDNDNFNRRSIFHLPLVEQETVPANSGYVSVDSLWCHLEISGNLPICHASNGLHDDVGIEIRAFLPVVL